MVTTFSPPVKAKKKSKFQVPVLPASLGAAVAVLLIGLVMTNSKLSKERAAKTQLSDTVVATGQALGLTTVTAEALADATNAPVILGSVATAAVERVSELATARTTIEQSTANATRLESEVTAAQEQLTVLQGQVTAAKAESKTKVDEAVAAQKKAADEVARLNATVKDLQVRLEEALVAVPVAVETEAEVVEAAAEDPVTEPVVEKPAPVVNSAAFLTEGKSSIFKSVRYDAAKTQLIFLTIDDQVVIHKGAPQAAYDQLIAAPIFDIFYRFQIMDDYESEPKIRDIIHTITTK